MLESLILVLVAAPILFIVAKAFVDSKDYFDYDKKKCRYVSRIVK